MDGENLTYISGGKSSCGLPGRLTINFSLGLKILQDIPSEFQDIIVQDSM